jgi:D-amino-acid dehydrogenase
MRVAVIGAGVVGLACAATLAQRGHLVRWIDPDPPGQGCSAGNAGLFSLSSFVPLALPGAWAKAPGWLTNPQGPLTIRPAYLPRALPWLWQLHRSSRLERVVASADAMHALLAPTWDAWLPLAQWAGASALIRRDGWAAAYRSKAALDGDALGWRLRRERGIRVDLLTGGAVREFDPNLSPLITHLCHLPDQGHCLDPLGLCQALARAIIAQSARGGLGGKGADAGEPVSARALGFEVRDGRVAQVHTERGSVDVDAVVLAAGAFSGPLALQLGARVPLDTERGYHVTLKSPTVLPRVPLLEAEGKWFATPMNAGLRLAGTVEFAGLEADPNWRRADALVDQLPNLLPQLSHPAIGDSDRWMGRRPSLPDSRPVIGRSPRFANAVLAFGHAHVGLTSAAMTGRLVAQLLMGERPSIDLSPFAPDRFGAAREPESRHYR